MTREIIEAVHVIEKEKGIDGATLIAALGISVETGLFGARMRVEIANDGPVTIVLGSA